VITVTDLWTEWSIGLGSGQLDSSWGAKWMDQNERQLYSRRLPIIKAIHASGAATSLQQASKKWQIWNHGMSILLYVFVGYILI
jgi:transcriptional activator of glycolytic enzymes GCR1